jgi:hypothetical protein
VSVKRTMMWALILLSVAVLAAGAWLGFHRYGPRTVPAGQPPLRTLNAAALDTFVAEFNAQSGKRRLLVLLSPT